MSKFVPDRPTESSSSIPKKIKFKVTDSDRIIYGITAKEMYDIDMEALNTTGPNIHQMQENASAQLCLHTLKILNSLKKNGDVIIFSGSGGNGGVVLATARHLANRGIPIHICLSRPPSQLKEAVLEQFKMCQETELVTIIELETLKEMKPLIIIDGVLGYSSKGAPTGTAQKMIQMMNFLKEKENSFVISLDVPSGLEASTGLCPGDYVRCNHTLTTTLPKNALVDPNISGRLFLVDTGIPVKTFLNLKIQLPEDQLIFFDERMILELQALDSE